MDEEKRLFIKSVVIASEAIQTFKNLDCFARNDEESGVDFVRDD